jgi:hypothetical protein
VRMALALTIGTLARWVIFRADIDAGGSRWARARPSISGGLCQPYHHTPLVRKLNRGRSLPIVFTFGTLLAGAAVC